jgi:hypothetical protein
VKEGGKANELSLGERITFSRGEETCWIAGAMGQQDLYKAKFNYTCDSNEFRKAFSGRSSTISETQMRLEKLSLGKVQLYL